MSSHDKSVEIKRAIMVNNSRMINNYLVATCGFKPYNRWEIKMNNIKHFKVPKYEKKVWDQSSHEFGSYCSER